jgi:hypothetical protein
MVAVLPANQFMYLGHFDQMTLIYIKQYGAGNLRLAADGNRLLTTVGLTLQDGIAQATADGWKQYYWQGDLFVISDAAGPIAWEVAGYVFNLERGKHRGFPGGERIESELEGDLSTY